MIKPNYNFSNLNLMSSIARAYNVKTLYNPLKLLNIFELKKNKNIVLIIVDGLSYNYLQKYGLDGILKTGLKGKLSSVFPSATTAAIPVFYTGDSCLKYGMVSWHSWVKELGQVITPLPYITRAGKNSVKEIIDFNKLFNVVPLANKIKVKSYIITKENIKDSVFSKISGGKAERIGYKTINSFFNQIRKTIKKDNKKKFINAYYPTHDSLCHDYGCESKKVLKSFKEFDFKLGKFLKSIKGTNTKIIITSDHGAITVPKENKIFLKNHPELVKMLNAPLCGDNRYSFCFVKADKKKEFEKYVKTKLKKYCIVYKSMDLVKKGFFGLEKPSQQFLDRIGDYTLIAKENYAIYQQLVNEKRKKFNLGEHGGLSKDEMCVPLIIFDA